MFPVMIDDFLEENRLTGTGKGFVKEDEIFVDSYFIRKKELICLQETPLVESCPASVIEIFLFAGVELQKSFVSVSVIGNGFHFLTSFSIDNIVATGDNCDIAVSGFGVEGG